MRWEGQQESRILFALAKMASSRDRSQWGLVYELKATICLNLVAWN